MREAYRRIPEQELRDSGAVDLATGEEAKEAIRRNVENGGSWQHQKLARQLYGWTDRFRERLIDPVIIPGKEGKLPGPVIGFDKFDYRVLAYYRLGKNAFGLDDEIILNEKHLARSLYSILETVLHEQVHLWQQRKGEAPVTRNYHNKEFVEKCESLGLHPRLGSGVHERMPDGAFAQLMAEYGIERPAASPFFVVPEQERRNWWQKPGKERKGRSTLEKWSCACGQNARIGAKSYLAVCALCQRPFLPQSEAALEDFVGDLEKRYAEEEDPEVRAIYQTYLETLKDKQGAGLG